MPKNANDLTQALLAAARNAGAESADAMVVEGTSISIEVLDARLEHAERSEGIEIGLRVMVGQRQACVASSNASEATIRALAERAVAMAREAPEDPNIGLADPVQLWQGGDIGWLELADPAAEPAVDDLLAQALEIEAAALGEAGVTKVQSSTAAYGRHAIALAASNGFAGSYTRSHSVLSCAAISGSGSGMERDHCHEARVWRADLPDAAEVGRIAGMRAAALRGSRRPRTGAYPVLFDERVAGGLIGHLLQAINGASIARGSSWARRLMDEQVLPEALSLVEDPHRPRISGSRPFDAEGLPTARRVIVSDGVLRSWTLDLGSGRKLGLPSTANAVRSPSGPPTPAAGNVTLTPGSRSRDELLREMGTGLLVTSLIGSTINPNTGDYSRGASGFWVENGEISHPVNECTLAGNLVPMLRSIVPANDARPYRGHQVPSLLVEGLATAGA